MDTRNLDPFVRALTGAFSQMFGLELAASPPREITGPEDHAWELSGILGIAGQAQGIVAVRLPAGLVDELLAASGVRTENEAERKATVAGLVGEITNIVAGNAIADFPELELDIAPPIVIKGKNHQISWPRIAPVLGVAFQSPKGPCELALCFKR